MNGLLRSGLVLLLVAHAAAHLPGFLVFWELETFATVPFTTKVWGGLDVGVVGTRIIGTLWLVTAVGIVAAAVATHLRVSWMPMLLWPLIALSAVLCVLGWPATRVGLAANLVVVALLIPVSTPLRVAW
jgi:hypothetical protein